MIHFLIDFYHSNTRGWEREGGEMEEMRGEGCIHKEKLIKKGEFTHMTFSVYGKLVTLVQSYIPLTNNHFCGILIRKE